MAIAETFFIEFDIVLIFALIAGVISLRLKIPPVISLLFIGMLIGPNVLGYVNESSIGLLSEIGAIMLLLMVGVEFSISKLLSTGLRAILVGSVLVFMSFLVMYQIATELDFNFITSLYIAAMFSLSSTAIIIKVLEQKGMLKRQEVPFLIAILIIEDLIAVFMLTFFSSLNSKGIAGGDVIGSIIFSLAIMLFSYLVIKKLFEKFSAVFMNYQAEENLVFFSFALALGMSILASLLKLTPSIGAFLAGSLIASLPNGKSFERVIKPFTLVFSSFFFLSIGLLIDPKAILGSAVTTSVLIASFMAAVFIFTSITVYLVSSNGKAAVLSGLIMLPIGEFSLLIAKESAGIASINLVGIASAAVLVTTIASSLLMKRYGKIYGSITGFVHPSTIEFARSASEYTTKAIGAFEPKGEFYEVFARQLKISFKYSIYLAIASVLILLSGIFLGTSISIAGFSVYLSSIATGIIVILCIYPAFRIALSIAKIAETFSKVTTWTTSKNAAVKITRKILLGAFLMLAAINVPTITNILKLPALFDLIAIPLAIIGIFFIWNGIKDIPRKMKGFLGRHVDIFNDEIVCEQNDLVCLPKALKIKK